MKKLFLYVFLGLLWCNVSSADYCKSTDIVDGQSVKEYADKYKNYYVPEEAYKFGLEIQSAFKHKDVKKLLSLIKGDLRGGPEESYFIGKSFDDLFSEEYVKEILKWKPNCFPMSPKTGFILGVADLWYDRLKKIDPSSGKIEYGAWSITRFTEIK